MLSSKGFINDFLNVGINQNKSISIISITEINGWLNTNQKTIAINAKNKHNLSQIVIFVSHFLNEIIAIHKQNKASNKETKLQYHQLWNICIANHIDKTEHQII